ncbi:hypothetical protein CTI14_44875, partial [Methylobacterium radiotolerans]
MRHGQVDGFLQVQAVMHVTQEEQELPLFLLVSARRRGRMQQSVGIARGRGQPADRPFGHFLDLVSALAQGLDDLGAEAGLQRQMARLT